MFVRITVWEINKPIEPQVHKDIDWICKSLGFVSPRDYDHTSSKVFNVIVLATAQGKELSSDEISELTGVTRGAVVHHLRQYLDAGLIIERKRRYSLRKRSIEKTIEEVQADMIRVLDDIKKIAIEVDKELGLKER